MKTNHHPGWIAGAILASASVGWAATANIAGQNKWVQTGAALGGSITTVNISTDQHASGNAAMVFDVADGADLNAPAAVLDTPVVGGLLTVSMKMYFPSTSQGSVIYGFDDNATGGYSGGMYVTNAAGDWRDRWVTMKWVVDLDQPGVAGNGTYYFDDMFTPAGTFDYAGGSTYVDLWLLVGNGFNGGTVTGPFYFDDMEVKQGSTVVWSDNFDSYILSGDPNLISIDVIAGGSVAVSGDVTGSPFTGQSGLWNELALDGNPVTLSTLTDGAGAPATGVGFVFDSSSVGYHLQPADAPYNPGVVLTADNPERSWVTGGESPVTFKFTGLSVATPYDLAIYTSGDPLMTLTVNGTPTLNPGAIFSTTATADASGEIVCQVSCGGDTYSNYAEIAGIQLRKLTAPPALAAHAGADKALSPGSPSAVLGATPAAAGGTPAYTYLWSPATGLDNATLEHPTVTTTAATTTYTLTVTDSLSATATDEVVVTYTVPALAAHAGADKALSPGTPSAVLGATPAATGGTPAYTYLWSPTTGLDNATLEHPTVTTTAATTTYTLTVTDSATPTAATATDEVVVTYEAPPPGSANLVSIDVVRTDSTAVSGNVTGGLTGQVGLWNRLVGSSLPATLTSLTSGDGATTAVGLTASSAGFQSAGTVSGVVLAADSPERLWVTGTGTLTLTFTGLSIGGNYDLAIFNTGSNKGIITINGGTPNTSVPTILTTSEVADGDGKITAVVSFNGAAHSDYMEISGLQIKATGTPPAGYAGWATANAGGQASDLDYDLDGMSNGVEYFMGATGSSFTPNPPVVNTAGVLTVTWPRDPAVTAPFKVQVSDDLSAWTDIVPPDASINTTNTTQVTYTLPSGAAKKFCRLVVTP